MKLGWLVWEYEDTSTPEFKEFEPSYWVFKKVQIAYIEIVE